jgi:hypothetical protein
LALAAVTARSTAALADFVTPRLNDTLLLLAAFLLAALLGATVASIRVLLPLAAAMCLGAAVLYGALIYLPAWRGIVARSITLQDYASQQALVIALWLLLPVLSGAVAGHFGGARLRRGLTEATLDEPAPWWERDEGPGAGDWERP